ncbi:hypothetical protein GPECTOR_281g744 [Gonium pectorale]|uniref:Uncharacterized protein n=1 Tax=Gonium pectorale TaxID=33097 RepID=A0A150FX59_GONPE|nr:hypothetical protein GPECTOR_281g744 [Gonium pectorale]|eukprot:KXZ41795.1 hypothetical protein GPECTOR_281g744 [Gonium pectorale]
MGPQRASCHSDKDKVQVFLFHTYKVTRAKKIRVPMGEIKLEHELKKGETLNLPVTSLLTKFDGKSPRKWATDTGCTEDLWKGAYRLFKGEFAIAKEQREQQQREQQQQMQ